MSISSMPQSPTQNAMPTSPKIQHSSDVRFRRFSLSPTQQLLRSPESLLSPSDGSITKSPKATGKIHIPHSNQITHLNLDLSKPLDVLNNKNIISAVNNTSSKNNIDDSPQLLATSVNATDTHITTLGGFVVPSTSNISLLSLNPQQLNQLNHHNVTTELNITDVLFNPQDSSRLSSSTFHRHRAAASGVPQFSIGTSRKSSFNSPTMQGHQTFNSQFSRNGSINLRRSNSNQTSQQQPQQQPIQILQERSSENLTEPDSPPLGPVSLSGSPSNFFLSHSSPPGSYKAVSVLSGFSQRHAHAHSNRSSFSRNNNPSNTNLTVNINNKLSSILDSQQLKNTSFMIPRSGSISDSIGGRSPEFAPVSSTLPPMTPLVLSMPTEFSSRSDSNAIVDDDDDDDDDDDEALEDGNKKNDDTTNQNNTVSKTSTRSEGANGSEHISVCEEQEVDDIFGENIDD